MSTALQACCIRVLCVDDNPRVAEALKIKFSRIKGFHWRGWLPGAEGLPERAAAESPVMVLLDLDMPGPDPFDALAEISEKSEDVKVVVFSGHVRKELIERALDAGAWGYVSKNDGEQALIDALRTVAAGEVAMSPEIQDTWSS